MKIFILFAALSNLLISCNSGKIVVKQSEWQQAIQSVVPEHQCICDTTQTNRFPYPKKGSKNLYLWQKVITPEKNEDSLLLKAGRVKKALEKQMPELQQYPYVYIEFMEPVVSGTTTKYKTTGTAYFVKGRCSGFLPQLDAAELAQRVNNRPFLRKKLCKN
ncbi:MAG: hypothetical protein WAT19_07595 [Ferruginibacter sp.]